MMSLLNAAECPHTACCSGERKGIYYKSITDLLSVIIDNLYHTTLIAVPQRGDWAEGDLLMGFKALDQVLLGAGNLSREGGDCC